MADLKKHIDIFTHAFFTALSHAATEHELEEVRRVYLSRHGKLTDLMSVLKELSPEEKRIWGPTLNALKEQSMAAFNAHKDAFLRNILAQKQEKSAYFDVTASLPEQRNGSLHPYTYLMETIEDIFISMGYEIADGPEAESDLYNFEYLNIPAEHPARDLWDTLWLDIPRLLLRTHTSSVQARSMRQRTPPLALIAPGRCYRHEATDATHDFMFMQVEGLFIQEHVSLVHLLATIQVFLQTLFHKHTIALRTRPSYFPFVEPGIEIDMSCPFCLEGCSVCKKTRWVEICGAGLVHPRVLEACAINSQQYSGFAFGFGLSRLVMLKFGINDIRLLHTGKIDFLKQF